MMRRISSRTPAVRSQMETPERTSMSSGRRAMPEVCEAVSVTGYARARTSLSSSWRAAKITPDAVLTANKSASPPSSEYITPSV